jgi:two-component system, NarL family, sensor histidine kinase DegS
MERLRELATSTLEELRQFSRDLRPSLLDDLGLVPALEWLILDIGDRTSIETEFLVDGEVRRPESEVEVALYRIVQEAVRNVEHHAGATRVEVAVRFEADRIHISVRDDGHGFQVPADLGTLISSGKLGLMGMQERAQLAGGSFRLNSHRGVGTVVAIDMPR